MARKSGLGHMEHIELLLLRIDTPLVLKPLVALGLLSWLEDYEYVVTTFIAVFTAICAVVGLFAVRENLQTDHMRFKRLSPEAKEILRVLAESGWKDFISVMYGEIARYMALEVRYRNDDRNLPSPAGLIISSHFHFALLELLEKGFMERQEGKFYLTNKGNQFLEKFESRLKRHRFHDDTCFENKYAEASEAARERARRG